MGMPFSDITLYTPTSFTVGTPEYYEETSLINFISDLYVCKMNGYKPPKTTRVTIQPAFYNVWKQPWKNGSIISIAPFFSYDEFSVLDLLGKYKYILNLTHDTMLELSKTYGWDKAVFEKAYKEIIGTEFSFQIKYPVKQSRDKKNIAKLVIEKTHTVTSAYVEIQSVGSVSKTKLFDKKNVWWYDCIYILAKHSKWFDSDRFGISYRKNKRNATGQIDIWYSIQENKVSLFENGSIVKAIDFSKLFTFG